MGHLTTESLARLVSEAPSAAERRHLEACPSCRSELSALQQQTEALGALPDLRPPPGDWEALEARLISEGLLHARTPVWSRIWRSSPGWLQAAAGLVLFLGGAALGSRVLVPSPSGGMASSGPPGIELLPVSNSSTPAAGSSDLATAAEAVRLAERQYMDALLRYRQLLDSQGEPGYLGDPASRFAALEAIVAAGRAAVEQAPADPYVNGVLVSALAEREALLRTASLSRADGIF